MKLSTNSKIIVVYDHECPFCQRYCQLLRLRQEFSEVQLVNAREPHSLCEHICELGLSLDEGMVVQLNNELYHGADAIHILALLSSKVGWFNRVNHMIFSSKRLSSWLYPVLRAGRNLLLRMLGRKKINNI
jgi:predicted DCC family thiol-disulfide oxidoreductase YuxK